LNVMGEVGRVYYMGVDLLLILFLYCSTWLLLVCILNGTSCIMTQFMYFFYTFGM
jgi:hypothetical protein